MKTCIFPGTFDIVTNGHIDIIQRVSRLFDKVVVGVAKLNYKNTLFNDEERLFMMKDSVKTLQNVEVKLFDGLLVDFCKKENANVIIRSIRNSGDVDYETAMAAMNKTLYGEVETLFLPARGELAYVSSSLVKSVALGGGDISAFVPPVVLQYIYKKLAK